MEAIVFIFLYEKERKTMKVGIVGLPNVGKSTLFNALTNSYAADAANFPFCTIEPNEWMVNVNDQRIEVLATISNTKKTIYATTHFVDIAGLVRGASKGEGLGNKFLSHIRETDTIVQVVRHFDDNDIIHVEWWVDPMRDVEIINTELIMADLDFVDKKLEWMTKRRKMDKEIERQAQLLEKFQATLAAWKQSYMIKDELNEDELKEVKQFNLLTFKPFLYAFNVSEGSLQNADAIAKEYEEKLGAPVVIVCAVMESELLELEEEEKADYLADMLWWVTENPPTLDNLITRAYDMLGLMYYFTTGEKETRAWTIKKWSTAPQAAGAIHTDFERGFIKAEVVTYDAFVEAWWRTEARNAWSLRLEWKEYVVQDGDVIVFKFNV